MFERVSTVGLVFPLVTILAALTMSSSTPPPEAEEVPVLRIAPLELDALGDKELEITGAGFAYCSFDEDCGMTSILRIGKSPMQFVILTTVKEGLLNSEAEFSIEILSLEQKVLFETSFQLPFRYAQQRSALLFRQQPRAIAGLEPGKYLYRIRIDTLDGKHGAGWEREVLARK